jgi:hypothetical protein
VTQSRRNALLAAGAIGAAAAISGFMLGTQAAEKADWHTATAEVVGEPERPLVSIEVDGRTYAINESVPYWIDGAGVHDGGWPVCLSPNPTGSSTQVPREVPIRFATVKVAAEDVLSWHQVVAVDCRPAA